ncbi:MAG: hypothetical protein AB4368_12120 [Xenococcaceae cyanobacterium]
MNDNRVKELVSEIFTITILSFPTLFFVHPGISDRAIDPTMWEAQIRSDGMAAWVNDHLIQDCTGITRIGSNKSEWSSETEYDGSRSTLYGSYALYCQQTNRSAKSPQNFSAELLELCTRILGWQVEKDRVKMAGQTVRVIKGLRLRTHGDGERPTVEEILEGFSETGRLRDGETGREFEPICPQVPSSPNHQVSFREGDRGGDNRGDNLGDNSKPLPNIESARGDNLGQINKEEKNKSNSSNKNQTVLSQINWQSYPYNSSKEKNKKERASLVKEKILNCGTSNELIELKISEREIDWLKKNVLTQGEREQLKEIELTRQGNLLSVDSSQEKAEVVGQRARNALGNDSESNSESFPSRRSLGKERAWTPTKPLPTF